MQFRSAVRELPPITFTEYKPMIHLYGRDLLQCGFSETRFLTGTALVSLYEIRRPGAKLMIQVVALLTV